jgi:CheY-like chemotaxis protein
MQSLLIVDDLGDNRMLLRLSPGQLYPMVEAEDAATAWDLLLQHQPRGVILEVMMPVGRDGFDLCAKIRADANPEVKATYVLHLTARGQVADRERGRAHGRAPVAGRLLGHGARHGARHGDRQGDRGAARRPGGGRLRARRGHDLHALVVGRGRVGGRLERV